MRFSPRRGAQLNAALGAVGSRQPRGEPRLKLHRIQVPPRALVRMIIDRATGVTLGTRNPHARPLRQRDAYAVRFQVKLDIGHVPRFVQPKQQTIMLMKGAHPPKTNGALAAVYSQGNQKLPTNWAKNHRFASGDSL